MTAIVATAGAQFIAVTPTLTGYLHDRGARALRPIIGAPGSAFVGAAVIDEVDAAWPSPSNDAALYVKGDETLLVTGLRSSERAQPDIQLLAHPSKVEWDRAGNLAAILSADNTSIQRIAIGKGGVVADPAEPVGHLGSIVEMAISSSGDVALATADGIYVLRRGSSPESVSDHKALSLTFYSDDRLYASTEDSLLQIQLRGNSVEATAIGARIAVLRASPRSNGLLGIDAVNRKVFIFELSGSVRSELPVDDIPTTLTPLQDDSVFVLNGIDEIKPVTVLKASLDPGFYFVPSEKLNVP
jgi:hypothetical protein